MTLYTTRQTSADAVLGWQATVDWMADNAHSRRSPAELAHSLFEYLAGQGFTVVKTHAAAETCPPTQRQCDMCKTDYVLSPYQPARMCAPCEAKFIIAGGGFPP